MKSSEKYFSTKFITILLITIAVVYSIHPAMALEDGSYKATNSVGRPVEMKYVHVNFTFWEPEKMDKKARTMNLQEGTGELRQAIFKTKSNNAFSMNIIQSPSNGRCGGTDLVFELGK